MTTDEIPTTMKRLIVTEPGKDVASCKIEVEENVPVPTPRSGEVLIKVVAAPVNPSDYGEWYGSEPDKYPLKMGKEGSGVVVASGGGLSTYRVPVGTPVGFIAQGKQRSYAEYVTMGVTSCFPMPTDVPVEDCASFFVNPYTAIGILDYVKNLEGSPAFVHTAAASQLGQMIVKLVNTMDDMEVINVVRREEQAALLRDIGAKHIVVTGSATDEKSTQQWKDELQLKVEELGATCAFDAISGSMSGDLMDVLPFKGALYTYGKLGGKMANIDPIHLIYRGKRMEGFFLTTWVKDGGLFSMVPRMLSASKKVNAGLKSPGWSSTQFMDTTMEKVHADIIDILGNSATGKKLRIRFD
jgi:NADPH2:quinone reductase|mmetsp:Transcript_2576/g.3995  ORF Transcript_2576/g.3995 Transcript_2576/m.3995 type:complete len:355 (+) Transcript_2576:55-1119(+)